MFRPSLGRLAARGRRLSVLAHQPALARHLESLVSRHAEIESILADGSSSFCAERMREFTRLQPIAEANSEATRRLQELDELRSLAADKSAEAELRDLAKVELDESAVALDELQERLVTLLVPPAEGDERGVVLEVRPGVGGSEAGLFASEVFDMYEKLSRLRKWRFELLDRSEAEGGGTREASASIEGEGVHGLLRHENGVHRVQRIPATESLGRVHTSTAVVQVLPQAEERSAIEIKDSDLQV